MEDLETACVGCYKCNKKAKCPLNTCLSAFVYQQLQEGLYTEDVDPVTQLPVPKQLLLSKEQRDQLSREHCGRQFHQECEGRRVEAAYDNHYTVRPVVGNELRLKDFRHRLCKPCLQIVQPDNLDTMYTGLLPGILKDERCQTVAILGFITGLWYVQSKCKQMLLQDVLISMHQSSAASWQLGL